MSEILGLSSGVWDRPRRWLVLAPHPDDFDVVAVTLKHFVEDGCEVWLEVLTGGASGVEDDFVKGWEAKTAAREVEQIESCRRFGLDESRIRFHRLKEDAEGFMEDSEENEQRVHEILGRVDAEGVILPHGRDSNPDHRRTFRYFERWVSGRQTVALLVKDPKTLEMRVDLVTRFGEEEALWKADLLRCHRSQQERNLKSRGVGFDERILAMNREIGAASGVGYAEGFEVMLPEVL